MTNEQAMEEIQKIKEENSKKFEGIKRIDISYYEEAYKKYLECSDKTMKELAKSISKLEKWTKEIEDIKKMVEEFGKKDV